jgi:hypothetical protein
MPYSHLIGQIARVTLTIVPGSIGEVMINIRGGTEAFDAITDSDEVIKANTRVIITEYHPPRTVLVSPYRKWDEGPSRSDVKW